MQRKKNTLKLRDSLLSSQLKHDVKRLQRKFHQIDQQDTGQISYEETKNFLHSLNVNNPQNFLSQNQDKKYQFDHILSILGTIEKLEQPSIYVIRLVNHLANLKRERLKQFQENGLEAAKQIDEKIKSIIEKEIQRKVIKIQRKNKKQINQLEINQAVKIKEIQDQFTQRIKEEQSEIQKKEQKIINQRNGFFYKNECRMARTVRIRYSILTAKKVAQLQQKIRQLVNQNNQKEAQQIKQKIPQQIQTLRLKQQNQLENFGSRRLQLYNKKKTLFFQTKIILAHNHLKRLHQQKKNEQQNLKIRFETLKKVMQKKIDQKMRNEIQNFKLSFYVVTKEQNEIKQIVKN